MSFRSRRSRHALRPPSRAKRLRFEPLEDRRLLAVYTVDNTNNSGAGSLAQAILDANANSGADVIEFAISGAGGQTIAPTAALPLPAITDAVTIDGFSQGGPTNTSILITLDGTLAGSGASGLVVNASDCAILGLEIRNFAGAGVRIDGTASSDADDNTVIDNLITHNGVGVAVVGTSTTRDTANLYLRVLQVPNLSGYVVNSTATHNTISENTITGNTAQGVLIQHASANIVSANTIGDNGAAGVEVFGSGDATVTTFAGTDDNPNAWEAYTITNSATGNRIVGNWIGINSTDQNISNAGDGVLIDGASLNTIGGRGFHRVPRVGLQLAA